MYDFMEKNIKKIIPQLSASLFFIWNIDDSQNITSSTVYTQMNVFMAIVCVYQ